MPTSPPGVPLARLDRCWVGKQCLRTTLVWSQQMATKRKAKKAVTTSCSIPSAITGALRTKHACICVCMCAPLEVVHVQNVVGEVQQLELLPLSHEVHDHRTGQAEAVPELHRVGHTSLDNRPRVDNVNKKSEEGGKKHTHTSARHTGGTCTREGDIMKLFPIDSHETFRF